MATRPEPSTADPLERASATEIADAVRAWLDALEPAQRARAIFPFETDERFAWAYTPGDRNGLPIGAMSVGQREAATATLDAALSVRGAREVRAIMALEEVLGQVERDAGWLDAPRRDPEMYWFSVFGEPGDREPWALRINGHHVAIVLTMAGGEVISAAPSFLGANPATIPGGPRAGERTIDGEETLARALLASLSRSRSRSPWSIRSRRRTSGAATAAGHRWGAFQRGFPTWLWTSVSVRASSGSSATTSSGRDPTSRRPNGRESAPPALLPVTFAWAGPDVPGRGHYYAIRGPAFLIEYDNTQDGGNHIHSVWRDLTNDWGEDRLAAHYREAHQTPDGANESRET